MKDFIVEVIIENKPAARDPEGETIKKDLIVKGGYEHVKSVRTGKYLKIFVEAENKKEAEKTVFDMCNKLRIYNPVAHTYKINVKEED
ncbi:MAG: phosphoribosylformylglycinamidine synthase subunit PurS [Candidatus Bathyarchaeota archaeon]|nr:phosphoribosylformylglycinamidine synthase subunit PurS [Candidatus Bathyarchaeota archaeon]